VKYVIPEIIPFVLTLDKSTLRLFREESQIGSQQEEIPSSVEPLNINATADQENQNWSQLIKEKGYLSMKHIMRESLEEERESLMKSRTRNPTDLMLCPIIEQSSQNEAAER